MTSSRITLTGAITALVLEKRAVGFTYVTEERVLTRFAAFCRTEFGELDAPTQACLEAWIAAAGRRGVAPATLQCLVAPVRELARWLGRRGVPAYVLPAGTLPRPARYVPRIFTDSELAALFSQTDRCHYDSQVPSRHLVMPVLFRTIYACGLRASEARLLRTDEVDTGAGVLHPRGQASGPSGRAGRLDLLATRRAAAFHVKPERRVRLVAQPLGVLFHVKRGVPPILWSVTPGGRGPSAPGT